MSTMRVVDLRGAPRERGRQHGETLRAEIGALHEAFVGLTAAPEDGTPALDTAAMVAYAREHAPYIQAATPDLFDEIAGIAEGAAVPLDTILTLTCVAEIRRLQIPAVRNALWSARGCTLFAVQGGAGSDPAVYVGQTYDIEPLWTPILFRIAADGRAPAQLVVGHPGILAAFGLNAAGIAFVASAILVRDQRAGLPAPILGRLILAERRLGAAAEAVTAARRTVGIHYVIAAPFGVIDLETSATRHAIAYVQDPVFTCANHIRSPDLRDLDLGTWGHGTVVREGRLRQLLADGGATPQVDRLRACLADHADAPLGICGHTAPGLSTCESRAAMIAHPASATLWVCDGTPCAHPFKAFSLVREGTRPAVVRAVP